MTKPEVLYKFLSGFGLAAYPDTSVPTDAVFPYLTYSPSFDSVDTQVSIPVNLWYRTEEELAPTLKAQEISDVIGRGGTVLPCDGGYLWIKRGFPWCQNMSDESNTNIKRRYINLVVEYLTAD